MSFFAPHPCRAPLALLAMFVSMAPLASCRKPTPALAEIAVLTDDNYETLAPAGKEVDAIDGDYLMRNDRIVAVIGDPVPGRNANINLQGVGGAVIDLTERGRQRDLLGAFYPGGGLYTCVAPQMTASGRLPPDVPRGEPGALQATQVALTCLSPGRDFKPTVTLTYRLGAGDPFLTVSSEVTNVADRAYIIPLEDILVAQGPSFERSPNGESDRFWAYDRWFGQAYGLMADGLTARIGSNPGESVIRWQVSGNDGVRLEPGATFVLTRRLYPAADTIALRAVEAKQAHPPRHTTLVVTDARGTAPGADVTVRQSGVTYGEGRAGEDGVLPIDLPDGPLQIEVSSLGRKTRTLEVETTRGLEPRTQVQLEGGSRVVGHVIEAGGGAGAPVPCKVMFTGVNGTPTPDFGPEVGERDIKNLVYTPDGRFSRVLPPGSYDLTFSHGPEYDMVVRRVEVSEGGAAVAVDVALARTVSSPGWVSADFHGHTTESGDTTASPVGRVLNLAAEGIEFAPCTEHNRLDTYTPLIHQLGLEAHLSSCVGLELTGNPFMLNHQNAFPLTMRPHTQGNGAPRAGPDPLTQIRRLWKTGSGEKLVQQNHPDIGWMFYDADEDGQRDAGFGMLPYQDAIEVYATNILKMEPMVVQHYTGPDGKESWTRENNRIFNWLQLLNQGVRLPGVANTDAHTNFHGSGGVRNYVKCATDDPARIDPRDIVKNAKAGHIVMTNGPFLGVTLSPAAGDGTAIPGDEIAVPGGRVKLHVQVQCPNWIDIDRVCVLLNGRVVPSLCFSRYNQPKMFSRGAEPMKFDQTIDIALGGDTHLVVVAAHKKHLLDPIMGPFWGREAPVAIANPIFVDVDGGGFRANGDTLDHPLPVKGGQPVPRPVDPNEARSEAPLPPG